MRWTRRVSAIGVTAVLAVGGVSGTALADTTHGGGVRPVVSPHSPLGSRSGSIAQTAIPSVTQGVVPAIGDLGNGNDPVPAINDGNRAVYIDSTVNPDVAVPMDATIPSFGINAPNSSTSSGASSGCTGRSNWPHNSYTEPGNVHAEGTISCNAYWPYLYMQGQLTRDRWYGEQNLGPTIQNSSQGYGMNLVNVYQCTDGTEWMFHLYNYEEVDNANGGYYGYTGNSHGFVCEG